MSKEFGKIILKRRNFLDISQRELAARIGINYTYLSKIENNKTDYPPGIDVVESLAFHLDLDPQELKVLSGRDADDAIADLRILLSKDSRVTELLSKMVCEEEFCDRILEQADDTDS